MEDWGCKLFCIFIEENYIASKSMQNFIEFLRQICFQYTAHSNKQSDVKFGFSSNSTRTTVKLDAHIIWENVELQHFNVRE